MGSIRSTYWSFLLYRQNGKCCLCGLPFFPADLIEMHHRDANHDNHQRQNLALLHGHCHDHLHAAEGSNDSGTHHTDLERSRMLQKAHAQLCSRAWETILRLRQPDPLYSRSIRVLAILKWTTPFREVVQIKAKYKLTLEICCDVPLLRILSIH